MLRRRPHPGSRREHLWPEERRAHAARLVVGHHGPMNGAVRRIQPLLERWLLGLVVLFAAAGLAAPFPARAVVDHHGIDATLAVLVFVSGVSVPAGALSTLRRLAFRLVAVLALATAILPLLALGASRIVGSAELRHGILAIGVAPAEVASVGLAGMAGGDVVVAAMLLVASALLSVVVAGPVLSLLGGTDVAIGGVIENLALVVGLPLAVGLVAGWAVRRDAAAPSLTRPASAGLALPSVGERVVEGAEVVSTVAVLILVALVASQVHLSWSYAVVVGALALLLAGSVALGLAVGSLFAAGARHSVLLHVSMRDFAVASGIAAAAFGPASTGPLGVYGLLVIAWGSVVAHLASRRHEPGATS
jgi:predicted Na+-dependent transporter